MGAFSWSRDKAGTGGKTHVAGAPVVLPSSVAAQCDPPPAKRSRVWKRDDGQLPATDRLSDDGPTSPVAIAAAACVSPQHPSHAPCSDGSIGQGQQQKQPIEQSTGTTRCVASPAPPASAPVDHRSTQHHKSSHPASRHHHQKQEQQHRSPAAPQRSLSQGDGIFGSSITQRQQEVRQKQAELDALRQQILTKQVQLQQQAASGYRAAEAEKQRQKQERRQRLEAGFAKAFAEAKEAASVEIASSRAPLNFADKQEVLRVLACKTDYEVLRIQPGADAAAVRRRYREMAVALHPDKCRAEGATDAFQRLVHAYQNLLRFAR